MLLASLITQNPFGLAGLHWREGRFSPSLDATLHYDLDPLGPVTVALPEDLHSAVPKRRSEYLAGRACAALALRSAGLPETLGVKDRAPIWPAGAAGSISHSDSRVIAAVSRSHAGLGVDCETIMPADQAAALAPAILTPAETALCPAGLSFAGFLTLAFSAKEALYKALSPRLPRMPEFHDLTLTGIGDGRLHLTHDGTSHDVLFRQTGGEVLTLALLTR